MTVLWSFGSTLVSVVIWFSQRLDELECDEALYWLTQPLALYWHALEIPDPDLKKPTKPALRHFPAPAGVICEHVQKLAVWLAV